MANNTYIGVDLGTSAVKLLLVEKTGKIINSVSAPYPVNIPQPNFSEQDPTLWWSATKSGLKKLLSKVNKSSVKGISFSGQMHGLVMLDQNDKVIRPCILWNDGRSQKETDALNKNAKKLNALTGNIAFPGFTAPKIMWVKKHEPQNFKKIKKIMLPKDYLLYQFTHRFVTDYSDAAGTLLLDVKNKKWSKEMLKIVGIKENQLPTILESYEVVSKIQPSVARELGLSPNVMIVTGGADNAIAAIGTATTTHQACNVSLGTSGTLLIALDTYHAGNTLPIHSFNHANGKYYLMGCILSAASAYSWWSNVSQGKVTDNVSLNLKNDIYFLPYLTGERCPYNDPNATGAFFNLKSNTTRFDMSLAVLEGVAFALRDCLEIARKMGIKINSTTICGGGAKSKIWPTIIANALNVDVKLINADEGPGLGAAILAMVANHEYKNINDATKHIVKISKVIKRDKKLLAYYQKKYQIYHKLYPLLQKI
ncbi:MAG: xylulokinase [Bacilli bacterium]|nr:xylulokinase [Bacilli bacterium]